MTTPAAPDEEHQLVAVWRGSMNNDCAVQIDGQLVRAHAFKVEHPPPRIPAYFTSDPREPPKPEEPPVLWVGFQLAATSGWGSTFLTLNAKDSGEWTLIRKEELARLRRIEQLSAAADEAGEYGD